MESIHSLFEICSGRPVYVQTHNFPDPDALASGHGLCRLFQSLGYHATLCYDGQLDKRACKKMVEIFQIQAVCVRDLPTIEPDAVLICVDSQKGNGNLAPLPIPISACIDHHPTFVSAQYQYKDVRVAGSCAAIVADYYRQLQLSPDSNTATALLYGIKVDTRQFSRGVTPLDIDMFQFLNQFADPKQLRKITSNAIAFSDLKAYASAIETIHIYGNIGFSEIEFPCSDDLIAMISDFFLSLDEIDLSIVYCIREDGIKFSVRSELEHVHAGNWIQTALEHYGTGGGHPYMAGGLIPPDRVPLLGIYPEETIRDCFLNALSHLR